MTEYIEREAVLKIIGDNCPHDKGGYNTEEEMGAGAACYYIMKDVENIPTADVVPKSEVEKLNKELDELAEEHSNLIIEKDELFDIAVKQNLEIEALKIANEKMYAAIEATKAEVAREILGEVESLFYKTDFLDELGYIEFEIALAELKKKYTEGELNGKRILPTEKKVYKAKKIQRQMRTVRSAKTAQ